MTPFQRSLWFARGVLVLAGLLVVAAHFWPVWYYGEVPVYCVEMWQMMAWAIREVAAGRAEWLSLQWTVVSGGLVLFIAAGPFVAGILARGRPLLWIARLLMVGFCGWIIYRNSWTMRMPSPLGYHLLMGSFFIQTVGLFVIPKPPRAHEGEGAVES